MSAAITYDATGTTAAITQTAVAATAIIPYINAVVAIPLGPRPIIIDGQNSGSWDPFGSLPTAKAAIATAQQHATAFQQNMIDGLHNSAAMLTDITNMKEAGLQALFGQMLAVIGELDGQPPTAAQRQAIKHSLDQVLQLVKAVDAYFSGMPVGVQAFVSQIATDSQALTLGSNSIATLLVTMKQDYENNVIKYGAGIGGSAIVKVLGDIYTQTSGQLGAVQASINGAVAASAPATLALSKLIGIFTSLNEEYTQTGAAITSASDDEYGSMLQLLAIQDAQSYWQDAAALAVAQFSFT